MSLLIDTYMYTIITQLNGLKKISKWRKTEMVVSQTVTVGLGPISCKVTQFNGPCATL